MAEVIARTNEVPLVEILFDVFEERNEQIAASLLTAAALELRALCLRCMDGKISADEMTHYGVLSFEKRQDAERNDAWCNSVKISRSQFLRQYEPMCNGDGYGSPNGVENSMEGEVSDEEDDVVVDF